MTRRRRYKRRRRRSEFDWQLRRLGFRSYRAYLRSEHWSSVKSRYHKSKKSKVCAGCGHDKYQLHHNTYERLGRERLSDFTPLCDTCHRKFHRYLKAHKELKLSDEKIILEAIAL
jgi:hypothetical protein